MGQWRCTLAARHLQLWHTPGHSPDSISCYVEEDHVLLAADTLMPIPFPLLTAVLTILRCRCSIYKAKILKMLFQGHGEVILRGEIAEKIQSDLDYLSNLRQAVDSALSAEVTGAGTWRD